MIPGLHWGEILRLAQCQLVDSSTGYSPPASPCRRSRRWCPRRQRSRGQRWVREGFCSRGCCCWAGSRRRCWTWRWSEGRPQGHRRRSGTKRRSGTRSSAVENLVNKNGTCNDAKISRLACLAEMIEVEQIKALIDEEDGLDDDDHVDKVERSLEFRSLLLVARQSAHRGISGSHLELQEIGLFSERLDESTNYLEALILPVKVWHNFSSGHHHVCSQSWLRAGHL